MANTELRKQLLEELSARYAKIPAKLADDQKEERKAQATAEVLANTLLKIQADARADGEHISVLDAMSKLKRAVKSLDFSEASKQPAGTNHRGLTPSSFVGRVESYRNAARAAGEAPTFAEAARKVLDHVEASPHTEDLSFSDGIFYE